MQKNKFLIHLVYTLIAIAMIGFGMSLIIKANLGQSTVSGFTNALAHVINIKNNTPTINDTIPHIKSFIFIIIFSFCH